MPSPDEFIRGLLHAQPYDPVARREYYLRTRKLKGRRVGSDRTSIARHPSAKKAAVKKPVRPALKNNAKERRKAIEARIAALEVRLDKLRKVLAQLVEQAKARSGVEPKKDPKTADDKPNTTKEKADAAKRSKDYYDKNKKEILSDKEKALQEKIKSVSAKIKKMRAELAAAKKKALKKRKKSVPVGAGRQSRFRKGISPNG